MKYNIHWLCNSPSPYNDYLFQYLATDTEVSLKVHFRKRWLPTHPWTMPLGEGYPCRYYKKILGIDWNLITFALKDKRSMFVLGAWNHATAWVLLIILLLRKHTFIIWTDTPNLNKQRAWIKDKLRTYGLRLVFSRAVAVMSTGRPGCEVLKKMRCPKEKIINFPYWTPLPKECDSIKSITKRSTIFYSVGRLDRMKAYDLAIVSLRKIVDSNKHKNIKYWIFGDGPERNKLEVLAKKLCIEEKVKFWGWQDPAFIREKVKIADVFIHPAQWEPYGVAVLEAMALGKPLIASDKTMAALDRIQHGTNGFIHTTGNIGQIENQMSFFVHNHTAIIKMGREARRTAEEWPVEKGLEIMKKIGNEVFHMRSI